MTTEEVRASIYKKIDELYDSAKIIQELWMRKIAQRELSRKDDASRREESTSYEFRLEFNGPTFVCRWIEVRFVRNGNRTTRLTKSIAVPRDGKYKSSQFKRAEDWELTIIEQMEEALSKIRNTNKNLMKAVIYVQYAAKANGEKLKPVPIKERVTPTSHSIKKFKSQLI